VKISELSEKSDPPVDVVIDRENEEEEIKIVALGAAVICNAAPGPAAETFVILVDVIDT
jgi:hypothetical protein